MTVGDAPGRSYAGRKILVAGAGVAGRAAATQLLAAGAHVTVVDQKDNEALTGLAEAGATVAVLPTPVGNSLLELVAGVAEAVISPGFAPHHPIAAALTAAGLDVYSEPELAWRMRGPGAAPWLAVTGTNGKTTTVTMLEAILKAAGRRTAALGNIGVPLVTATTAEASNYDVLAVELSSFQLHWSRDLAPEAGAVLNVAEDHLDWHGGFDPYAGTKALIWRAAAAGPGVGTAVGNLDDPAVAEALAQVGGPTVGVTLGRPGPGQFGVVDGVLVEAPRQGTGLVELLPADLVRPVGVHNVANALAAAALARSAGVAPAAVRAGLAGYVPEPHRNAHVTTVGGVAYVNDSKATNPHAAMASMCAYPRIVWIAGGQLKGTDVGPLVAQTADRLVAAVLLGVDRQEIADALARHAPDVPVLQVATTDDGAMREVVRAAAGFARPGDTVLLAPAAASLDMFPSYARRGDLFAEAVGELAT